MFIKYVFYIYVLYHKTSLKQEISFLPDDISSSKSPSDVDLKKDTILLYMGTLSIPFRNCRDI